MSIIFRVPADVIRSVRADLRRPHAFAYERVGFMTIRAAATKSALILLPQEYHPVADEDYLPDDSVGAMMGPEALRKALEMALLQKVGVLHVHLHDFPGRLWFSSTDLREQEKFIPDFFKVRKKMPHGAVVLGPEAAAGRVWLGPKRVEVISEFNIVGSRFELFHADANGVVDYSNE